MSEEPMAASGAPLVVAAVDLGATSGRVMLGRVYDGDSSAGDGSVLELEEVARFPNEPVQRADGLHWDIAALREAVLDGLTDAAASARIHGERIASVGIDSWAVDYGVLRDGELLTGPFHYRDPRHEAGVDAVHRLMPFDELYERNGLQLLPFNTLYQFAADPLLAAEAASDGGVAARQHAGVGISPAGGRDESGANGHGPAENGPSVLLIPDLFAYWLTGVGVAEETNASTTGLVRAGVAEPQWDADLATRIGVTTGILPPIVRPGAVIGTLADEVAACVGLPSSTPVVAVGSHDTASAVVATPLSMPGSAFISCGTWGLVGVETPTPVLTPEARDAGFTNERGVDGTTRLLHNVMGLWVLNECVRAWHEDDTAGPSQPTNPAVFRGSDDDAGLGLAALLDAATRPGTRFTLFDIDDPRLMPHGDMPARVARLCAEAGGPVPGTHAEFVRSIVESLADAFARAAAQASALAGTPLSAINIVGGGARNALLCQATADRARVPVIAGPVEATALGNVLVQARAAGSVRGGLRELRRLVIDTQETVRYAPQ
jgi:rhamnulokinase